MSALEEGRGRVGPAPEGRCTAEFITEEGSREGSKPGALDGSIGPHGRSWKEAQHGDAASHGLAGHSCAAGGSSKPPPSPPPSCGTRLGSPWPRDALHSGHPSSPPAQHPIDQRQGLKALRPRADHKTQQREQWVCSGYSQKGKGRPQKSLPRLRGVRNSQFPLFVLPSPAQAQRRGVRTSSVVDQRVLESCHFLRHRENQVQMKKHWRQHFK